MIAGRLVGAVLASSGILLGTVACDDTSGADERTPRAERASQQTAGPRSQEREPRPTIAPDVRALDPLPRSPSSVGPRRLARHLVQVERVLWDADAAARDIRRAAEFQQLAGRMLGRGPETYAEKVLDMLPPVVGRKTRAHVEAAALLDRMGGPVSSFPDWRIVEPPAPRVLLDHYRDAGREVGVPWEYLAAVHLVETRMGRIRGVSSAGAQGPMQFLPSTWDIYGRSGDITDARDAIFAAARLLRAHGAPGDMAEALWHYNPSDHYVGAVSRYAEQIRRSPAAYLGYWHWRVLYEHVDGTVVLEPGYPDRPPKRLR